MGLNLLFGPLLACWAFWALYPNIELDFYVRPISEGKAFGPLWWDLDLGFWAHDCVMILIRVIGILFSLGFWGGRVE